MIFSALALILVAIILVLIIGIENPLPLRAAIVFIRE